MNCIVTSKENKHVHIILIFGFLKQLTANEGLRPHLNLQIILLCALHTLLIVFVQNLLLHLEYSCFVINFIILMTCMLNIILLMLGQSCATLNSQPFKNKRLALLQVASAKHRKMCAIKS